MVKKIVAFQNEKFKIECLEPWQQAQQQQQCLHLQQMLQQSQAQPP